MAKIAVKAVAGLDWTGLDVDCNRPAVGRGQCDEWLSLHSCGFACLCSCLSDFGSDSKAIAVAANGAMTQDGLEHA